METSLFPGTHKKANKIVKVFAEYDFVSVVRACFCIEINRDNRSALENCLSLNEALIKYSKRRCGKKQITNYIEFKDFFAKIEKYLPISYMDDYTVPDFGEVKIVFKNVAYKIFIGTGHTQIYSVLKCISTVAQVLNLENEVGKILKYQDYIISYFENENVCKSKPGEVCFVIPEEKLFIRTWQFFDEGLRSHDLDELNALLCCDNRIEKQHFVLYENKSFPLFNTTIALDYMFTQIKGNEEKLACQGLYEYINEIEQFANPGEYHYLFPVNIKIGNNHVEEIHANIAIFTRKGLILCFDSSVWVKNKEKYLDVIRNSNDKEIDVVEIRQRQERGYIACKSKEMPIRVVVFNSVLNMDVSHKFLKETGPSILTCTSVDLMELLMFSDDENELWEFVDWRTSKNHTAIFTLGGISSEFFAWKEAGHFIEKGALSFGMVNIGYNESIEYIWQYFRKVLINYPWNLVSDSMFNNPFAWKITHNDGDIFDEYVLKSKGFGGKLIRFRDKSLFLCNNVEFFKGEKLEDSNHIINEVIPLVEDIYMRVTASCKELWESCMELENTLVEVLFMPNSYYEKVSGDMITDEGSVYSEATFYKSAVVIRFTVSDGVLYKEICDATDRRAECDFYIKLLQPLKECAPIFFSQLEDKLDKISHTEKQVDVFPVELSYNWNTLSASYRVDDIDYHEVRKRIAQIIDNNNIEAGEYFGKEANSVIRKVQKALITDFEDRIALFDKEVLHVKLLELYASVTHNISVHRKRYLAISSIDATVKNELYKKIIREREEFKHQKRVLEYVIETNLYLNRNSSVKPSVKELQGLLAYANWLVVLADNADICYLTDSEAHINVSFEKVIDVVGKSNLELKNISERMYGDEGYGLSAGQQDKEFIEKAVNAFMEDTGISIRYLLDVLDYLARSSIGEEIAPNVIAISEKELINGYLADDRIEIGTADVERIIKFVTIIPEKLKTCAGKTDYYLPIGRRQERSDRFEIKSLWITNERIIYSPVLCSYLRDCWFKGITEFYLPYSIGLDKTHKVLEEWKRVYERKIVFDIEEYFQRKGFKKVFHNLDLRKMDKYDKTLRRLGDYDVLVIDAKHKKIWMIECKVLAKVGSFYEMFMQQKSFFLGKKEDEHFQTRIDYMTVNYINVLKYLKCNDECEYEIKPYMVMNKVMASRYKKVAFPIISISELFSEIDRWSNM